MDEVESGEIMEDLSTDGQVVEKLGRRKPGLDVKSQPDHQVNLQGTGVITKGVPADGEIQFFGFPDYHGEEKEEGKEEYEYYEDYDESGEGSGEEESGCLLYTSPSPRDS